MGSTVQQTIPHTPPVDSFFEPTPVVLFDRYRVMEVNNAGGFGSVFICWDPHLQRRVAIKRIPFSLDDGSAVQTISMRTALDEARTQCMLKSNNIVSVYDFLADDHYSYLIMEYVDGMSLAELLMRVEDGVLSYDECAHVVDSVASALAYAHENRALHLDIKPANILIERSGTVKLTDFGMATLASAAGYGGARGGTVGYMPPEQITGDYVDERTDIFSLAVVVWEALTGTCPFAAQTAEKSLSLIDHGPSQGLSKVDPDLAGAVEGTLLRALEPNPTLRMSTIEEFALDLVPALGDINEGRESLVDLLSQTGEEPEDNPRTLNPPISYRVPWLPTLVVRLLCASTMAWMAHLTIPHILPQSHDALVLGTGGLALACAAWPPMGGAVSVLLVAGAVLAQPARMAFPLALLIALVGLIWWGVAGRQHDLATVAFLCPACLGSPLAGVGLSGYSLSPGAAFITAAGSYLFYALCSAATETGFLTDPLLEALKPIALDSSTWILAMGCGLAATICSFLAQRHKLVTSLMGQAVAIGILVFAYVMCAHAKNSGFTSTMDIPALAVAVFFCVAICIVSALTGQSATPWKGDDRT